MGMNESLKGGIGPLPSGILSVHSDGTGVISTVSYDNTYAKRIVREINTHHYQQETFYSPQHPDHLYSHEFPDNSMVVLYNQSAKYSEISALVIAKGPETFSQKDNELVPVEYIYNFPKEVQQTYWQFLLGGMRSFQKSTQHIDGMRIFIGENNISTYSSADNRTSRSIGNPHAHIVGFIKDHVEQKNVKTSEIVQYLKDEQKFTRKLSTHIARRVENRLVKQRIPQLHFTPQEQPPYGYSFSIPYSIDDIITNPQAFSELMIAHHEAYTAISQQMEKVFAPKVFTAGYKQFIPQPSYRLYLEEMDKQLYAAISPEYLSHAGIIEAASYSLILDRDPSNPKRIPDNIIRSVQQNAVRYISNTL